jgi:hypothetical protein
LLIIEPMNEPPLRPEPNPTDLEHLQLLGIFHYIVGGLMMLFTCFFIIYIVIGLLMALDPEVFDGPKGKGGPPPAIVGYIFAGVGSCAVLTGWTTGGLMIYSGTCLRNHRRRMFSQIMAGIACMFMPFGTILGVFTLVVLQRDSVRQLYGQ